MFTKLYHFHKGLDILGISILDILGIFSALFLRETTCVIITCKCSVVCTL